MMSGGTNLAEAMIQLVDAGDRGDRQ